METNMSQENKTLSPDSVIASARYGAERDYWLDRLSGEIVKCYFPYDDSGGGLADQPHERIKTAVTGELFKGLVKLSGGRDHTLHMLLVAAVMVLLDRYAYDSPGDIIVGAPIYKRSADAGAEYINTVLPLGARLEQAMTFKELLLAVRRAVLDADRHKNYPIGMLVSQLGMIMPQEGGDFPLFDAAVLLESIHDRQDLAPVKINMIFSFSRLEESLELTVYYNSLRYREATVRRIADRLPRVLEQGVFNVDLPLAGIDLFAPGEKKRILEDFNRTAAGYPRDKTVHQLFGEQVERRGDAVAVVDGPAAITYRQLAEKSGRLAGHLKEQGVLPDDIAAIMIKPSIDMIIGIMGILKAGAAFLPIDPDYPKERIDYMLTDSSARLLLTKDGVAFPGQPVPGMIPLPGGAPEG
jgi:non-ribosomal peptide synthetase component F